MPSAVISCARAVAANPVPASTVATAYASLFLRLLICRHLLGSIGHLQHVVRHREARLGIEVVLRRHLWIVVALFLRLRDVVGETLCVFHVERLDNLHGRADHSAVVDVAAAADTEVYDLAALAGLDYARRHGWQKVVHRSGSVGESA